MVSVRYGAGSPAILSLVLALAACGGGTTPTDDDGVPTSPPTSAGSPAVEVDLAATCEAAEEEGTLVYWQNFSNPDPILAAFGEAYPDVEVEYLPVDNPDESMQRIITEESAGSQITPDLISGGPDVFQPLIERGIIDDSIDWQALEVPEDLILDNGMVRTDRVAAGPVYNTDNISPEELPDTWEGFADEQWQGQIVVDPRGRPFDQLSLVWGEEQTLEFVQELTAVAQPIVVDGGTAGMLAVAGGEALVTMGGRSAETLEQQAAGAPLEIKYMDLIPTLDSYHAVIATARHHNAAMCFTGWMATDGAEVHQQSEFKSNDTIPAGAEEAEIIAIDTPEKAEAVSEIGPQIGETYTGN